MLTDCNFLRWLISWHPWCSQKRTELVSDPSPNDVCYCADLFITKWNPDDLYPFCHTLLLTLFTLHLMWSNLLLCDSADTNQSRALGKYDICEMKWNDNPIIGLNFKNVTIFLGTCFLFWKSKLCSDYGVPRNMKPDLLYERLIIIVIMIMWPIRTVIIVCAPW